MAVYFLLGFFQGLVGNVIAQQQEFGGVVHAAVFFLADVDYVFQYREALAFQVAALRFFQFRQHGVYHVDVAAVEHAVGDAEGVDVGVLYQKFEFVLLVIGVDGDQDGADLGSGVQEGEPVGYVGSPDAHVGAVFYADREQSFGHVVDATVEFAPGEAQVAVGINEVFFVGGQGGPVFEPLAECLILKFHRCRAINRGCKPRPVSGLCCRRRRVRGGPRWNRSKCCLLLPGCRCFSRS